MSTTYKVELIDSENNELTMTAVPDVGEGFKALMAAGDWTVVKIEEEEKELA